MTRPASSSRFWAMVTLLAIAVLIARSAPAVRIYNHTFDEPYHIGSAISLYEAHAHVMGVQHGPLPRIVAGIPLWIAGVREPLPPVPRKIRNEAAAFAFGADAMLKGPVPYWRVLKLARWAMLLVFPPVCLWYTFLLGRWLAGPRAGGLAAVFFSLDPTLLGHCFWVCTDVPACAGFLVSLYHGLRWLDAPTKKTAAIAGVALGLAVGCKFSCLLVVPGLVIVAFVGVKSAAHRLPPVLQMLLLASSALGSLWATYLFTVGPMNNQNLFTSAEWAKVPNIVGRVPVPMPSFWLGLEFLLRHDQEGHPSYLNGQLNMLGRWYYFPEAIGLKEPVALLAAVAVAAILLATVRADRARWRSAAAVLVPAGLFLAVAMHGQLNLGIRHILPVIPCLYLFVAIALVGHSPGVAAETSVSAADLRPGRGRFGLHTFWRPALLLLLITCSAIETIPATPDFISWFNAIAGGPVGGERYLIDSNFDWGQDVQRLADYLHSPAAAGRVYTMRIFNVRMRDLNQQLGLRPMSADDPPAGLFAISVDARLGLLGYGPGPDGKTIVRGPDYSWLSKHPRVARIGTSIDVYDLDR